MIQEKFRIQIGDKMIANILEPKPEELDLEAIQNRLKNTLRFSGAKGALSIHQHQNLTYKLVEMSRDHDFDHGHSSTDLWVRCMEWARHHDDHEGILGDIVAPIKSMISSRTNILEIAEVAIDRALCQAHEIEYPNEIVRRLVYRYDKAAETIEWCFALGQPRANWNHACPPHLFDAGERLVQWARAR